MDITKLTDEHLKDFLEASINFVKKVYIRDMPLYSSIKGFRKEHVNEEILLNDAFKKIRIKNNEKLIDPLNQFYDDLVKNLESSVEEFKTEGFNDVLALSLAMDKTMNKKMQILYPEIADMDDELAMEVKICLNSISYTNKQLDALKKEIINNIDELMKENKFDPSTLQKDVAKQLDDYNLKLESEIKRISNDCEVNSSELKTSINSLKTSIDNIVENTHLTEKKFVKVDDLEQIKLAIKKIEEKNSTKEIMNDNKFKIKKITNDYNCTFVDSPDYLKEDIEDVVSNFVKGEKIELLKQYLLEIIFDNKPIISSKENSIVLAKLLSYILTGGTYYFIDLYDDNSLSFLFKDIEKIAANDLNTVFIFRNIVGTNLMNKVLNFVLSRTRKEKYILDIDYEKSIQFLPLEIIKDFNYFSGQFEIKEPDETFKYNLANRRKLYYEDYERVIKDLCLPIKNYELYNKHYKGILAYSLLPFISNHEDINVKDLIDKISNKHIRECCEAIVDD